MEHDYKVKDFSLLTPYYTKFVVDPLMKFVPWWIPANLITILSNFCILLALTLTLLTTSVIKSSCVLVPLLILAYATGDFIDGKQARRTKTSSILGEFMDHFLDIFANGILMTILLSIYEVTNPTLIALYFTISYVTLSNMYFEQHNNKILFFEKLGPFETIILFTILITLGFVDSVKQFFMADIAAYISIIDLFIIGIAIGALFTLKQSLVRTGKKTAKGFISFFILTAATAFLSSKLFQAPVIMFVMTAYCSSYIGKLHTAYLVKHKEPTPDFIFPLFLAAAIFLKMPQTVILSVSITYQILCPLFAFTKGFMQFKNYWIWRNPGEIEERVDVYTT
jgi:ethanolaminephosphotransferase